MTLIPIANMAAMFCTKYDGNQALAVSSTVVSTLFPVIGIPIFMLLFFCRLTEAVFKICFAWAGKQLSVVFLNSKIQYGPLAQLGERQVRNLEVRGSIPLWSTKQGSDEHLFFQWRFRREVFALIHNRKAPSWE